MARKDLSRTVIEGGRYYHNCYFRRASNGEHRATTRAWLDRVAVDLDEADACDPPPRRRVHEMFRDKLGPARRWLLAQVGRPWDKVYADLCARFDTRTVAGRHVVHDHMLGWVRRWDAPAPHHVRFELVIDAHGILRKPPWHGHAYRNLRDAAHAWAAGRVAASTYRGWWWFCREPVGPPCQHSGCERTHHDVIAPRGWPRTSFHAMRFVGVAPLTRGDLAHLDRLPPWLRAQLVIASPL